VQGISETKRKRKDVLALSPLAFVHETFVSPVKAYNSKYSPKLSDYDSWKKFAVVPPVHLTIDQQRSVVYGRRDPEDVKTPDNEHQAPQWDLPGSERGFGHATHKAEMPMEAVHEFEELKPYQKTERARLKAAQAGTYVGPNRRPTALGAGSWEHPKI
jgi:hypothetical protein